MTRADKVIKDLTNQGWKVDHEATSRGYRRAGSVEDMKTRNGVAYVRVYTSETHGKRPCYQVTVVLRKEEDACEA